MQQPGQTVIIKKRASFADTMRHIERIASEGAKHPQIRAISKRIASKPDPVRAAFDFAYNAAVYVPDPLDFQDIRYPQRTLKDGIGNCVDYSVLISSILRNVGIPHRFRVAAYHEPGNWEHIYIVAGGRVLDCVLGQKQDGTETFENRPIFGAFGKEHPAINTKDFQVTTLRALSGISNFRRLTLQGEREDCRKNCNDKYPGHKNRKAREDCHAQCRHEYGSKLKVAVASPARLAFLGLVDFNVRGLAHKLQKAIAKDSAAVKKVWVKTLGGDWDKLLRVIEKGAKKKPFLGEKLGCVDVTSCTAELSAAATAIAAFIPVLKSLGADKGDGGTIDQPTAAELAASQAAEVQAGQSSGFVGSDSTKILMISGAAVILLLLMRKK
jgi:Transglutaminase-like superfamily